MFCRNCGAQIEDTAVQCPQCGAETGVKPVQEDTIFCTNCGQKISKKALICPHCGVGTEQYRMDQEKARRAATQAAQPSINIVNTNTNTNANTNVTGGFGFPLKNKWTAFFLCLFLGVLGVHRFYVGKTGSGVLYLFTGGLCGIGWVIDLILILLGGFKDKWGRPLA